jgi:hypothetical protein
MREVRIVDFPLPVALRVRQHAESLSREFAIIALGGGDEADVPKRLLEIAQLQHERYAGLNPEADEAVDAALDRNQEFIDFTLYVPERLKGETVDMAPLLLEVDEYCRSGDLLTPPPTDEMRAFWLWFLAEIVRQLAGEQPVAWRDFVPDVLDDHDALLRRVERFNSDPDEPDRPAGGEWL